MLARLFRSIRVDAIVEPMRIFTEATASGNNQRPDVLLRNSRGLGRQIIIDVAVTGIESQSRASDDLLDRPLRIRHEQKVAKYARIAERNGLQFAPTAFSQIGQVYGPFKSLIKEQIRQYLIDFEGQAKLSEFSRLGL